MAIYCALVISTIQALLGERLKTIKRLASGLKLTEVVERYVHGQHVADETSISQVAVVLASRYTTCQRTSFTKRC